MKDYVNWAILAPGIIANSMARAMKESSQKNSKIRLYAVGSRNLERSKEFAEKWGFEKSYGSYEELLKDPEVDAVYVANPHAFHFDSVMACIENGKHVLCEKPAGCNLMQLTKMIEAAKAKNLFFMEAMWTAFNPCVNKIWQEIKAGTIGELKHIESHFCNRIPYDPKNRLWAPEQAGGALLDLGIYNIYFAWMLNDFRKLEKTSSTCRMEKGVDAWDSVNLVFENGVTSSFVTSCDTPAGTDFHNAIIFGSKGFITTENFFMAQKAQVHTYKSEWGNENEITKVIDEPFSVNGYEYELIEATKCILEGKLEVAEHPHSHSVELCKMMDDLRAQWNFKYPFEK